MQPRAQALGKNGNDSAPTVRKNSFKRFLPLPLRVLIGKGKRIARGGVACHVSVLRRGALHLHLRQQALRIEGLRKVFRSGASELVLFDNLSFELAEGEMLAIVGESGAGKSTLLHIVGALDRPSSGDVYCAHLQLSSLSENAAADFRNREIGFVWQFHYLLPEFTALEMVAMLLLMRGNSKAQAGKEATPRLREFGLST